MERRPFSIIPVVGVSAVLTALRRITHNATDWQPGPEAPKHVEGLDVESWLRWCYEGLHLFAITGRKSPPVLADVHRAADRAFLAVQAERSGQNITHMAAHLDASRKCVRDHLIRCKMYPLKPRPEPSSDPASSLRAPPMFRAPTLEPTRARAPAESTAHQLER